MANKGRYNDRFATWAGVLLAVLFMAVVAPVIAEAECNCSREQQCAYETCCYTKGTCFPTGQSACARCEVSWHYESEAWQCATGGPCSCERCGPIFED